MELSTGSLGSILKGMARAMRKRVDTALFCLDEGHVDAARKELKALQEMMPGSKEKPNV